MKTLLHFDTSHGIKKICLYLGALAGVDIHRRTIIIASCLFSNETESTFE